VHLVRLFLRESSAFLDPMTSILSNEELDRADRFHFEADRALYVLTRASLRVIVGRYLGVSPSLLRFSFNDYGKPHLDGSLSDRAMQFNVSHSGSSAVLAFARGRDIGVDLEVMRTDLAQLDLAKRVFSESELQYLQSRRLSDQASCFFGIWTRKEAYLKGLGRGLTVSPKTFTVSGLHQFSEWVEDRASGIDRGPWRTVGVEVSPGYACAVAVAGPNDWDLRCFEGLDVLLGEFG
jgi:4'-phosphopantetheinyl transferase